MCGIAGAVGTAATEERVRGMLRAIAHRGPDNEGVWREGAATLGHRRLSILDLTDASNQPMTHDDLSLTYNGELYNSPELRRELESEGVTFHTTGDTEVLLAAWRRWGERCTLKFRGMWAFAVWDRNAKRLFASRDPFGIKPFYWAIHGNTFLFASEPKALLAAGLPARANLQLLAEFLAIGLTDHREETSFAGIHSLPPGATLSFAPGDALPSVSTPPPLTDYRAARASSVEEALQDSVNAHLLSDVPVGVCLSGGVDSSTIASLLAGSERAPSIVALTARPDDASIDETGFAKRVAEHAGVRWEEVSTGFDDFSEALDACLRSQDEPVGGPSVVMQYLVMKKSRECGLKVMLDGQGGDELFLGYERYYATFLLELARRGKPLKALREAAASLRHSRLSGRELASYLAWFGVPGLRSAALPRRASFLKEEWMHSVRANCSEYLSPPKNTAALQQREVFRYNLPRLLRYEDRNSMAHGIEARVPFVDAHVAATAFSLDATEKIRNGFTKFPVRTTLAAHAPKEIAWRRAKLGFDAPVEAWLNRLGGRVADAPKSSQVLKALLRSTPRKLDAGLRWRLFNIAQWEQSYGVSL